MKKSSAYYFVLLSFYLSVSGTIGAQPFVTRIYTANNGLPDAYTQGVYQDKQGYLWIGTYTGLSRFDGEHFVTVEVNHSPITNSIVALQDHLDRLWVVTRKTVAILNKDSIVTFPTSDGLAMDFVFDVIQLRNKKIWALGVNGAYEFTGNSWKKIRFPAKYRSSDCRQIIEVSNGLYINFGSVIVFEDKIGNYKELTPVQTDRSFYINMHLLENRLYAISSSAMYRIENGTVREIFRRQLSTTRCYNFLIDSKKRFWVSTEKHGILVSEPGNENVLGNQVDLPFNLTTYLFEDRDHNIWATNYEGLVKIKDVSFMSYNKTNNKIFENIRFLTSDTAGNIYIASTGNGLYKIDADDQQPHPLNFSAFRNFNTDVVDGISFDDENSLWIVTRRLRLLKYKNGKATDLSNLLHTPQLFYSICFDKDRRQVLIASDKLYVGDEKGFRTWGESFNVPEITQPRFICKRNDGSLLINTLDSGIYFIDKNNKVINISSQLNIARISFLNRRIYEDPQGGFWVMTPGEGLTKYKAQPNGDFKKIVTLTTKEGLPNNTSYSAVFDRQNRLWLATLSGLATITRTGPDFNYTINHIGSELSNQVLNWGAAYITSDKQNNIWVSTFHELIKVESGKTQLQNSRPGIAIENVTLNSKTTNWNLYTDSLQGYFHLPYKPGLDHRHNSLSISFQGISYSINPGLRYSYKLISSHSFSDEVTDTSNWSEPATSNNVSFVKLPPADYTFVVKVRESGTAWSEPAYFLFSIQPPFWTRWWFRSLFIIFIAVLIGWIFRIRIKRIQHRSVIQDQLHQLEMKALKAQMNPHFIYNALNSIQSLVVDNKQQEAIKYISKFAKLLRQVLEQSGKNFVTLDKELSTIELYIQLEMLRMNMQLNYHVSIDEQVLAEKEWVPPLILQPFVENALWHGLNRKEGDKRLTVKISSDDEWIFATIVDNGIGRQKAGELKSGNKDYPRSMGMEITGKRLQLINHDPNTSFAIKDLKDKIGEPIGTEVIIKIKRTGPALGGDKF